MGPASNWPYIPKALAWSADHISGLQCDDLPCWMIHPAYPGRGCCWRTASLDHEEDETRLAMTDSHQAHLYIRIRRTWWCWREDRRRTNEYPGKPNEGAKSKIALSMCAPARLANKVVNLYCGKSVKLVYCTISKTLLPSVKIFPVKKCHPHPNEPLFTSFISITHFWLLFTCLRIPNMSQKAIILSWE